MRLARRTSATRNPAVSSNLDPGLDPGSFVRWLGGKRRIAAQVLHYLPARFERYVEPFLGGGAIFFALCARQGSPVRARLSDAHRDLITLYRAVRDDVDGLIAAFDGVRSDKALYYALRDMGLDELDELDILDAAARMYYLNRHCFNGSCRVNKAGRMNVPYGRTPFPLVDEAVLRAASVALQEATLEQLDFRYALGDVVFGDVVYVDSPYMGGFVDYTARGFDERDHEDMAWLLTKVARRCLRVVVSLPDCELARDLYPEGRPWTVVEIEAPRSVSRDGNGRKPVRELLLVAGRLGGEGL